MKYCINCGAAILDPVGRQIYCSAKCMKEYHQKENIEAKMRYPSKNEEQIIGYNTEVFQPGSPYKSYGDAVNSRYMLNRKPIKVPEGYTSMNERKRKKA